jgi:hypothetical protein
VVVVVVAAASFFAAVLVCADAAGMNERQQRKTKQGHAKRFTVHLLGQ